MNVFHHHILHCSGVANIRQRRPPLSSPAPVKDITNWLSQPLMLNANAVLKFISIKCAPRATSNQEHTSYKLICHAL